MIKLIGEASKKDLVKYLDDINLEDKRLYDQVNDCQAFVFQFSGGTASSQVRDLKPDCFDDMMDINATSRPGASGSFPDLVAAKEGAPAKYPKIINNFLKDSHGIILFQEEIMKISSEIGGADGNYIRGLLKKLGKKNKRPEDLEKWGTFVQQLSENGIKKGLKKNEIDKLVNDFVQLSAYSFNKSHAYAYTYLAMETVYLSTYFKPFFYAVNLTQEKNSLKEAIKSCSDSGFMIVPPDVNKSGAHFFPEGKKLYFGLGEIKGVGDTPLDAIARNRPYSSIIDFICKNIKEKGVTKRVVSALLCGGAFDSLINGERKYYETVMNDFYETKKTIKTPELLAERWSDEECRFNNEDYKTGVMDFIDYENNYLGGNFFHGIFSDEMRERVQKVYDKGLCLRSFQEVRDKNIPNAMVPVSIVSSRPFIDKNKNEMMFMEIEDCNGETVSVPIFASYWKLCKSRFNGNGFYFVSLYENEAGNIMFGSKNWLGDDRKSRMILEFKLK